MSLKIIKAGLLDTVQDKGRTGYRHLGINPSGCMDIFSAQLSNALLGKKLESPVIEMHFPASAFLFQQATIACLAGANFSANINDQPVPLHQPFLIKENSLLEFSGLINGAHCYLSILHDLQADEWLHSASTNLKASAGGFKGRRLLKDNFISYKRNIDIPRMLTKESLNILHWKASSLKIDKDINCIKGNEWDWLTPAAQINFQNSVFSISNLSDRMGYRLYGEELAILKTEQLISSAVNFGTIQLLPNGQLIVLMADHQTTGGYPRLAHVSSTSLPSLAQLRPNDEIRFRFISIQQAENDLIEQQKYLEQLQNACKLKIENLLHATM
jgi:antagonist of KipI